MVNKKNTRKILIFIMVVILLLVLSNFVIADEKIEDLKVRVEYEYNEESNTVTGRIISNNQLKNTKVSWEINEDKTVYTNKNLKENGRYETTVEDIYGNKKVVEINVTLIDDKGPEVEMEYKYNAEENTVTAIMHSKEELRDTKKAWNLSEDKLTYTNPKMTSNGAYYTYVEDKWGNQTKVLINVTLIDDKGPEISMEYIYNKNDTVTVIMHSNEEMADTKPSWSLSENKLLYSKEFSGDQKYYTPVEDKWGNETSVEINFKKRLDRNQPNGLSVGYMYIKECKVLVQILSQVKMQNTKPTWEYKSDGYRYIKSYYDDINYTTTVVLENGTQVAVNINVDYFFKIDNHTGTYGYSGAIVQGKSGGSDLMYYKWGNGANVMFATFCVHGFEDSWGRDGSYLVKTADKFYQTLIQNADKELAKKWTIYILREVNPDGRRLGNSNVGPGRRTLYSKVGKGIDINRAWQTESTYKRYTDSRNYNGTAPDQAYEAEYLKNFLLSRKSTTAQNVLVDLHGWENQLIGNEQICNYYKQQYPSCSTRSYGKYGTQYLIAWARQNLGAKTALVELPKKGSEQEADNNRLSERYIDATINMLKGI